MNKNLTARASITINAPSARVWDALVSPEAIKQYNMFGTHVVTDWREGSPITWKGEWQDDREQSHYPNAAATTTTQS